MTKKKAETKKPASKKRNLFDPDKKIARQLRYKLPGEELIEASRSLAEQTVKIRQLEADKKRATQDYGAQISAAQAEQDRLGDLVSSGYELRKVECAVFFDTPEKGKKTIFRIDTGEHVGVEPMTHEGLQVEMKGIDGEVAESVSTDPENK